MPNENNMMSLKTAPLTFASFIPVQYTTQPRDYTNFAKSMAAQEAREEKANQYLTFIDNTLGEKRKLLNKEDYGWLAEQADKYRQEIDKQINLGNWQSAIRVAQQSAKDLARNTELEDRIRANEIYTTERNKIQSGNYSPYTKRRWDAINKYKFDGTISYHSSGEEIYWYYNQIHTHRDFIIANEISKETGYKLVPNEVSNTGSGYKDWFIEQYEKPGLTIEVSPYVGPVKVPIENYNDIWQKNRNVPILFAQCVLCLVN